MDANRPKAERGDAKTQATFAPTAGTAPSAPITRSAPAPAPAPAPRTSSSNRPVLSPDIPQWFIPLRSNPPQGATILYRPRLLGWGDVYFTDTKTGVDHEETFTLLAPLTDNVVAVEWTS